MALTQLRRLAIEQQYGCGDKGPDALLWLLRIFPPPEPPDPGSRDAWVAVLAWLCQSHSLPAMAELKSALVDLDRGVEHEGLTKPKGAGQGRRASASQSKMGLLRVVMEAANKIGEMFPPTERDEMIENKADVPLEALRRWRQMVMDGPTRFHPRTAWHLFYGAADPVEVLKDAAARYRMKE